MYVALNIFLTFYIHYNKTQNIICQRDDGSYLINLFVEKTMNTLNRKGQKQPFLYEILDEIQQELRKTKQLPTFTCNNNTRYIKLMINNNKSNNNFEKQDVIEMNAYQHANLGSSEMHC